jgi:hypothetical protein
MRGERSAAIKEVDYEPDWPRIFDKLSNWIWSSVCDMAVAIEYVASTSVPGAIIGFVADKMTCRRANHIRTPLGTAISYPGPPGHRQPQHPKLWLLMLEKKLEFSTHIPTHKKRCLVRLPQTLAVLAVVLSR